MSSVRIGITVGDPGGIGPEVVRKALAGANEATFRVFGPAWSLGPLPRDVQVADYPSRESEFPRGHGRAGGELSFRLVEDAIAAAKLPVSHPDHLDAIVTGPISKKAWELAGHGEFPGHTELFDARFGGGAAMMFVTPRLRVILATTHIPLAQVPGAITVESLVRTITVGNEATRGLGVARPRIAVCGVNPHAGEEGLLGVDEQRVVGPAIAAARSKGIEVAGPFPGDTVFLAAVRGEFDLVVAMYHDQGLIPVKLLDRDRAVNVTVGLPVIRTSPDHGTAFDIAGMDKADPGSMRAAIELAVRLAQRATA